MMKAIKGYWLFILLPYLFSCGGENKRHGNFSKTIPIVTRQVGFDSVFVKYPYRVKAAGTSIYVTDLHALDFFCHEFAYPSMKYQKSFAPRGKAPGEVTDVINLCFDSKGMMYLLDAFARKIYAYDGQQVGASVELPQEIIRSPDFTLYNDSVFIVLDYSGANRIVFIDRNGEIVRRMGHIPAEGHGGATSASLNEAWRPFIHYNPRNGILALVTQFGEVLELYDLKNDRTSVWVGEGGEPTYTLRGGRAIANGIRGYTDVVVGDKYIYALFWGHEMEKMKQGEITVQGGNIIHIFDLNGKPVRKYEIDRYITGFCVNEETGEVLGTDVNEEQLVIFSL